VSAALGPRKPRWPLRAGVAALTIVALYAAGLGVQAGLIEYVQRILLIAGINVILAVGLNLINGTTGQFSIGHAGFMAVGAYTTAFVGVQIAPHVASLLGSGSVADAVTFNLALLVGAAFAGLAGLVVGLPSLRLKGDYLAIVTLGFGEIIRIVFNNAQFLGGATGYNGDSAAGLPTYTSFFWVFFWVIVVIGLVLMVAGLAETVLLQASTLGLWWVAIGSLIVVLVALERRRYRSAAAERANEPPGPGGGETADAAADPRFRPTAEAFIDPTSGHRMRVLVDPATGERRYVAEA